MSIKDIKKHYGYYLSLCFILSFGGYITLMLDYDKQLQMVMVSMLTFLYVTWGIAHHAVHHNISSKIVIEYILIGTLAMTIFSFVIKGAL